MEIKTTDIERMFATDIRLWNMCKDLESNKLNNNEITKLSIEQDVYKHQYRIIAIFEKYYEDDRVEIIIDEDGNIKKCGCDCPSYNGRPCIHMALTLAFVLNQEISALPFYFDSQKNSCKLSLAKRIEKQKNLLNNLIESNKLFYDDATSNSIQSKDLKIIAGVKYEKNAIVVSFSVGHEKMYIIKNLLEFKDSFKNETITEYGKGLKLLHRLDCFDEPSQEILSFLFKTIKPHETISTYRRLLISDMELDNFYELFLNKPDYINWQIHPNELKKFAIKVTKDEDNFFHFQFESNENIYVSSTLRFYLIVENGIYRFDKTAGNQIYPFYKTSHTLNSLEIHIDSMKDFYTYVLADILPYIDIDTTLIQDFINPQLKIRTYIDLDNNANLLIVPNALTYNDDESSKVQYLISEDFTHNRNSLGIMKILSKYNAELDNEYHQAIIPQESLDFSAFISEGIPSISKFSEVFVSNAIKVINTSKKLTFNIGVKYEHDLLKLRISSNDIPQDEINNILNSYKRKKHFYRLKSGETIKLDNNAELDEINDLLESLNINPKALVDGEVPLDKYRAFALENLASENKKYLLERSTTFSELINNIKQAKTKSYPIPPSLENVLRDYQKEGYNWLKTLCSYGFGGILADDMGLGKTLQIIALIADSVIHNPNAKSIVVCPTSLVLNWESEVSKFYPSLRIQGIYGHGDLRKTKISLIEDYDIFVTSYDSLRNDIIYYNNINFEYIILDEAQYIKNQTTRNAKSTKQLNGKYRIALTGTPIENSLAELWSIFDFLMSGYLFNYNYFKTHFEKDIIRYEDKKKEKKLQDMVAPFILRRTKKAVLKELPEKIETILSFDFNDEEQKLYLANVALVNKQLQQNIISDQQNKMIVIALMTRLRQLCIEPRLVYDNIYKPSTKLVGCIELIKSSIAANKQVILFSSFTSAIELIKIELDGLNITHQSLIGTTPKHLRATYVNEFQNQGFQVFLISLKAGGTGLNLTAGEVVIHFDPWWNISAQNQATDRAYRIGQKNIVQVYKLIMRNSIEERIMELQSKKQVLTDTFIENNQKSLHSLSKDELLALFEMPSEK